MKPQTHFTLNFSTLFDQFLLQTRASWFCETLFQMEQRGEIPFWPSNLEFRKALVFAYPEVFEISKNNGGSMLLPGWLKLEFRRMNLFHCYVSGRQSRISLGEFMLDKYGDRELLFTTNRFENNLTENRALTN